MKFLGIDYGAKRVGVAISDDGGTLAFAKTVLPAAEHLTQSIKDMCERERVDAIVVGESRDYAGNENPIMSEVHQFVEECKKEIGLPIYLEPELMTSIEAERIQGHSDMHDASAAALILKSFIDRTRNSKIENRMTNQEVKDLTYEIRNMEYKDQEGEEQIQNTKAVADKLKREKNNLQEEIRNS